MRKINFISLLILLSLPFAGFSQETEEECTERIESTFQDFDYSNGEIIGGSATNAPEMRFTSVTQNVDLVIKRDVGDFVMDVDGNSDCNEGFALNNTNTGDQATFCFVVSGTNTPTTSNAIFFLDDFDNPEGIQVSNVGLTMFAASQSNLGVNVMGNMTDFQSNSNGMDEFVLFYENISSLTVTFTNPNPNNSRDFCFASNTEEALSFFECTEIPLPIKLSKFDVEVSEEDVIVNWRTESEIDNDFFDIEQSIDGINFESVATIDGAGDSNDPIDYTFTLRNALENHPEGLFYRLRQTDFDGTTSYSWVVFTGSNSAFQSENLKIFPNPASDLINLTYPNIRDVKIFNTTGQLVNEAIYDGRESISMDVSGLEPGLYIVTVNSEIREKIFIR